MRLLEHLSKTAGVTAPQILIMQAIRNTEDVTLGEIASTVSLSHVDVNASRVRFAYADGAPCMAELGDPVQIPLVVDADDRSLPRKIVLNMSFSSKR